MPGKKTTVKKTVAPVKKSTTATTTRPAVTPANRAKYTDMAKKNERTNPGKGKTLAPKGTANRSMQDTKAKAKIDAYKSKYGVYPTPENVKRYGRL